MGYTLRMPRAPAQKAPGSTRGDSGPGKKPAGRPRAGSSDRSRRPPAIPAPFTPPEVADYHARARADRGVETAEDYVEAIADLIDADGEARVVDLARRFGVTHVTVIRTISRLTRDGLATARPYRSIFLTPKGRRMAERVRVRHRIVVGFLLALGVPEVAARADAEGIEHHVSEATLAAFERFTRSRSTPPR